MREIYVIDTRKALSLLVVLAVCLWAAGGAAEAQTVPKFPALAPGERPNVIVVMADDLGVDSSDFVEGLNSFGSGGAVFKNSFVSNSLCCPSRATFLRGQYSNNHGTITNWAPEGAYPKFVASGNDRYNFVVRLDAQGYTTAHYGKYLNQYKVSEHGRPPGWDRFGFITSENQYWENGAWHTFTQFHDDYTINRSADFVRSTRGQDAPFYLQVDLRSPHAPYTPPSRYAGSHAGTPIAEKPSFSEDLSDKPQWVRDTRTWIQTTDEPSRLERSIQNRRGILEETEVVADALVRIKNALSHAGKEEKTYVIFTSDNGYQLGEHGLPFYKQPPYEESIRVPLMIQGPQIAAGTVVNELVVNNDLAPTILDWAGSGVPAYMDGRSLAPLAEGFKPTWRDALMVEHWVDINQNGDTVTPPPIPPYKMVRTASGEAYVEYSTGEREYYDLATDPYQMENGVTVPENAGRIAELRERLGRLEVCSGASCQEAEGTTRVAFTAPVDNTYDSDGVVDFAGTAAPNSVVEVLEGPTVVATATADAEGNWNPVLEGVSDGRKTFVARSTDAAGTATISEPRTITVDTEEPSVSERVPGAKASGAWPASKIVATFSEPVKATSVNRATFKLFRKGASKAVWATVTYNAKTQKATLDPRNNLLLGGVYVVTVSSDVVDLAGNPLDQNSTEPGNQGATWYFTTGG